MDAVSQIAAYESDALSAIGAATSATDIEAVRIKFLGKKQGRLVEYSRIVFERFFKRDLAVDEVDPVAAVIAGMGLSEQAYRDYLAGPGMQDYEAAHEEATADQIFGVPIFVFNKEPFWGHDRIGLLERKLTEAGLARDGKEAVAAE